LTGGNYGFQTDHGCSEVFYKTLNRASTYAIEWRIHAAKRPETRAKRIAALVAMLVAGKKLH
jgi:uncharacterized protein YdeI (YjbR/CyaY-like superfamily)